MWMTQTCGNVAALVEEAQLPYRGGPMQDLISFLEDQARELASIASEAKDSAIQAKLERLSSRCMNKAAELKRRDNNTASNTRRL